MADLIAQIEAKIAHEEETARLFPKKAADARGRIKLYREVIEIARASTEGESARVDPVAYIEFCTRKGCGATSLDPMGGGVACDNGHDWGPERPLYLEPAPPSSEQESARAETVARLFHNTYESLAPEFGYRTRDESAVPWEDVPEPNRRLMIATTTRVLSALRAPTEGERRRNADPVAHLRTLAREHAADLQELATILDRASIEGEGRVGPCPTCGRLPVATRQQEIDQAIAEGRDPADG